MTRTRTLYVKPDDQTIWTAAAREAARRGESLSTFMVHALRTVLDPPKLVDCHGRRIHVTTVETGDGLLAGAD